ncbi:hypothetical protein VZT92_015222 [Zoarces viviparus]|uniref:Uncharacterized protein n=1 Tax=Zoarces viviparus TaxID=48416 RepID=A0AAW1EVR9_ZOAVI
MLQRIVPHLQKGGQTLREPPCDRCHPRNRGPRCQLLRAPDPTKIAAALLAKKKKPNEYTANPQRAAYGKLYEDAQFGVSNDWVYTA